MARRDEGRNAFDDNPLADATAGLYGLSGNTGVTKTNPNRVKYQPIDALQPDPTQPRRVIPAAVGGNAENRLTILRHWHDMAEAALQQPINARAIVRGEVIPETGDSAPALASAYLDLLRFAASCKSPDGKRHGLVNPITYATAPDGSFVIETGERRWTAYILLAYYTGATVYESIPARHMGEVDPVRQAAENMAREDLNAIGKARQLAKLLMWTHEETNGTTFTPLADCPTDQAYYAQAADLRAPRGWGERISGAMGGLTAGSLAQYRKLWTDITPEEWDRADAENVALNQMTRQRTNDDNFAMTNLSPLPAIAEADARIYATPPGGHPAPTTLTPPTVTTNGWLVGDRCIVATHGPGTITHIVTRAGVVVAVDNKPNPVRVHERDLTPLPAPRTDTPAWTDPSQHHIPAEPTHTPVPDGRSGDTVSMVPRDHTPAAFTDEEFEQPQRTDTGRVKRILQLDEPDAALLNRLLLYSENHLPAPHTMLAMIFDAQDTLPGTHGDALNELAVLRHNIERDLNRLNRLINMAHGYDEEPES